MTRNPWALTETQARAREDAILNQFLAARAIARRQAATDAEVRRRLERQFGAVAVRQAIMAAINRRHTP